LTRPGRAQGVVDLVLPRPPSQAGLNGVPLDWEQLASGRFRIMVKFEKMAEIRIEL